MLTWQTLPGKDVHEINRAGQRNIRNSGNLSIFPDRLYKTGLPKARVNHSTSGPAGRERNRNKNKESLHFKLLSTLETSLSCKATYASI